MVYNKCLINTNFFIRGNIFPYLFSCYHFGKFSCRATINYHCKPSHYTLNNKIIADNKHPVLYQIHQKTKRLRTGKQEHTQWIPIQGSIH